jgi:sporulation integral membrane protein YlbJ
MNVHALRIGAAGVTALALAAMAGSMLYYPAEAWHAALRGVAIWWDILFPALMPFFVIAELFLGFGVVHFFGTLFDPLMRPIFRVPGIGGFVMAMGFASGYPVGARLTAQLREEGLVGRDEGERLVAFTTSSDPIFLIGAVSVGFFHDPGLAVVLAAAHYGSCVLTGLIMRFHGGETAGPAAKTAPRTDRFIVVRALRAMHLARLKDGRPLGVMLKEAIESSLRLIFVIGGLVVFMSVALEMLTLTGVLNGLYQIVDAVLRLCGVPTELSRAVVNGLFEVTLGAKSAAESGPHLPLAAKAAVAAFILSWGGLSVHAQIVSLLNRTDLRYAPFVFARFIHALIASAAVPLLWEPFRPLREAADAIVPAVSMADGPARWLPWMIVSSAAVFASSLALLPVLYALYALVRRAST